MKIDISSIDRTQFMVHEHILNGEKVYLVQPQHIGCKWTQDNKIFRSSIWNDYGELISAGFPKFTNWGENQDNFPIPKSLDRCVCTEKLDGSLLIVSKYKGKFILRTRGTVDASVHGNGNELNVFFKKHPQLFNSLPSESPNSTWKYSWLFEWTSPTNRIILNYGKEPTFKLIGIINHEDYSLATQESLDFQAKNYGYNRPETIIFDSIENLLKIVEEWKGKEGIVVYSNGGQTLHKVKSAWYLALHRMKSELSNIERIVDLWLLWGMPDYQTFQKMVTDQFDFELFQQIMGEVSRICDAKKEVDKIVSSMIEYISPLKEVSQKDAALNIMSAYGKTNRTSIAFLLLRDRPLDIKHYKTLIMQIL